MASTKISYIILVTNSILKDTAVATTMYVIFAGHKKMYTLCTNVNTLSPLRPDLKCS